LIHPAVADEEFKVENSVYRGDPADLTKKDVQAEAPIGRSITRFVGGAVYDSMKEPAEIAIFEKAAQRFILINVDQRIRAELSTRDIAAFTLELQKRSAKNSDPLIRFSANPTFQERYDEATQELTLGSEWVTYRLTLMPESSQEIVDQYREFCDWSARLKAMLEPGSLPPFNRLSVNMTLAQRRAIASMVFLTLAPSKPDQPPIKFYTEHRLIRPLTPTDLDYVAHLRAALGDFKRVGFEQYLKAGKK
jgi:hypothetical protein